MNESPEATHKEMNRSCWTTMALEVPDLLSFGIEASREWLLNPLVHFARRSIQFGGRVIRPTNSRERKFKKDFLNVSRDATHALHMSRISHCDSFDSIDGVPVYLLGPPYDSVPKTSLGSSSESLTMTLSGNEPSSSSLQNSPFSGSTNGSKALIVAFAFSDDGGRFALGYSSGVVLVWDTNHGEKVAQDAELLGSQIIALSFRENSHTIVQIVTRDCQCVSWDLLMMSHQRVDISTCWENLKLTHDQLELYTADFCHNGSLVVISLILESGSACKMDFIVGEVTLFPIFKHITKLSVSVEPDFVVSGVEISPDKEGLIVGVSDNRMETGKCLLWPFFKKNRVYCEELDRGTLGSWSSNSDVVVTWTVPDGPKPEKNDGSSAFIWNIKEMQDNMNQTSFRFKPTVLESPFGEKVLWCRFVVDLEGKDRLIMALIGTTTRFLFWDVHSKSHTHTITTEMSTKDMPLASTKAWIESRVEKKTVMGLSPMAITSDRSKFGAILDSTSQVLIWDAARGVQSLKLTPKQTQANLFGGGADILFSPTHGQIAMIGYQNAMIFAPATASKHSHSSECIMETPMIELDSPESYNQQGAQYKLLFSGDGNTLGLLSIGSCFMKVYNLVEDITCTVRLNPRIDDTILDFSLLNDGRYLVTNTSEGVIFLWRCSYEKGELLARIRDRLVTMALGIATDTKEIVACSSEGELIWYASLENEANGTGATRTSKNIGAPGHSRSAYTLRNNLEVQLSRVPLLRIGRSRTIDTIRNVDQWEPAFVYESSHRVEGLEVIGCRISSTCERAVRVLQKGELEIWNLTERVLERTVPFTVSRNVATISQDSIPLSGVPIPWENRRSRYRSHGSLDKFGYDQETTILPEKEGFVVTTSDRCSLEALRRVTSAPSPISVEKDSNDDSNSIYIVNLNSPEHSRQLKGRDLQPQKGLAMSADGRHVACLSGKFTSKIVVWSAYASQELLPDYHSLSIVYDIKNKTVVKRETQRLLEFFGPNFFTFQHPSGLSIPLDAIGVLNRSLLCSVLNFAYRNNVKMSFLLDKKIKAQQPLCEYHNAVEAALAKQSPEIVEIIMSSLLKRITNEAEIDAILTHSLIDVHMGYSHIFERIISSPDLFVNICELEVPAREFRSTEFLTMKSSYLNLTESTMQECWKLESPAVHPPDSVALTASAIALPFKDACQFGEKGIMRDLLMKRAQHSVFGAFAIQAIVQFKWRCYAKDYVIQELSHHCLIAVTFTVYCFLLREEDTYQIAASHETCETKPEDGYRCGNEENSLDVIVTLFLCWLFTVPCLIREINQCFTYSTQHGLAGFMHWLKSGWNWMEVFSYFNIVAVIPFGQLWFAKEGRRAIKLSSLVALEALILWSRMLFYARPFRPTGPFVIVISSLATAIMPFLVLAFSIMFGFALAFYVLYRHVQEVGMSASEAESSVSACGDESDAPAHAVESGVPAPAEDSDVPAPAEESDVPAPAEESDAPMPTEQNIYASMHNSFNTFGSVLYTMFGYLFGEFDGNDVHYGPDKTTSMTLFVLYMVIMSVILINMLIAVMGEKFTRIQQNRHMRFIEARAFAIDDVDSMLSRRRKRSKIEGYLHVVSPSFILDRINSGSRSASHEAEALPPAQRESVYSQLERVLGTLRDQSIQEQQTGGQPYRIGTVQPMNSLEHDLQGSRVLEIAQNEDLFPPGARAAAQDPFPDSGMSHG